MINRELQPDEAIVYVTDHESDYYLRRLIRHVGFSQKNPIYRLTVAAELKFGTYYVIPRSKLSGIHMIKGVHPKDHLSLSQFDSMELIERDEVVRHKETV